MLCSGIAQVLLVIEKQIVLDMLKAGNNKEMRIQRAAEEVLQPEVLPNVQEWLTKTSEKGNNTMLTCVVPIISLSRSTNVGQYFGDTCNGKLKAAGS